MKTIKCYNYNKIEYILWHCLESKKNRKNEKKTNDEKIKDKIKNKAMDKAKGKVKFNKFNN